jgi:hypothetical protein
MVVLEAFGVVNDGLTLCPNPVRGEIYVVVATPLIFPAWSHITLGYPRKMCS